MVLSFFSYFYHHSPCCFWVMVIIAVFSLLSILNGNLFSRLLFHPYSVVYRKEYYRLVSGDLVHNDIIHLVISELIIGAMCSQLEWCLRSRSGYGGWFFLAIYFGSSLAGTIPASIRNFKDFGYSSAGASGSITGCIFSYIILRPNVIAYYLPVIGPVKNIYGGFYVLTGLIIYKWKSKNEMVNHEVHFYGALGGTVITLILFPGSVI